MEVRHAGDVFDEPSADVGGARRAAVDRDNVMLLFLGQFEWLAVDRVDDRPKPTLAPITRIAATRP